MSKLLDILLQRNNAAVPWGFRVRGGRDFGTHPTISTVTFGTLASQYLSSGDKILEIESVKADSLLQSELNRLIENDQPSLHLLVEKAPVKRETSALTNGPKVSFSPEVKNHSYETSTEQECVRESNGVKQSTKVWLRETNKNASLGEYDLQVNFQRTRYKQKDELEMSDGSERRKDLDRSRNQEKMRVMSENFDRVFRQKIGEWLEENMLETNTFSRKQQSNAPSLGDVSPGGVQSPPPPPPPSCPGTITGRRLKTELPERSLEPPAAIQNAMMTKDKKPFTYTPGGIDLSEIRSPRMQRRITRNACADEMPGIPAPTTNHHAPVEPQQHGNTNYSAMQSQLPSQVLPPVGVVPPPPPPPPPGPGSSPGSTTAARSAHAPSAANTYSKPAVMGRPPLGFDPNELLARVNKSPAYEPVNVHRDEPARNFRSQTEEKPSFESKQQSKSNEIGQNIYVPLQKEAVPSYTAQAPTSIKPQNEPVNTYASHQTPRVQQSGPSFVPSAVTPQESSSPFGNKVQHNSPSPATSPLAGKVETKHQAPWVTVYRTPQPSVPWAKREPESPKPVPTAAAAAAANTTTNANTRIIPIQIEGRDSPSSPSPSCQSNPTPPPFLQSQQARQQSLAQQQMRQTPPAQQSQVMKQQPAMQQVPNTRVIPIQIEGACMQQPRSPTAGLSQQTKFMSPQSPTPYSPSQEREQVPQWAPVQPKPFNKQPNEAAGMQQPEYGTYNTAGVPLSQLRKMQLSDDDRALMDKFKSQVEIHGNDILNDENTNPRYKGGYIPSRVFKMLDESVDDEIYLHRESDPRYRGAVIPSRAFRMLQCMTDTAGDMHQQVPRTPTRIAPNNRPVGGPQYQQEPPQGPYVPPSEQQVQEPRKYTGGSIPSRSFRMLQAMTGHEVSAPGSPSGRETPVSGINRWYPSPASSPIDPYWGYYYPPDPYFMYNYISDLNAAYGLPPPPPPPPIPSPHFGYPRHHSPSPFSFPMHHSYPSDNDEQGYSSTDELAQYYTNYRRNFGYSPYPVNPERTYASTPNSFNVPRVCVTPVANNDVLNNEKMSHERGGRGQTEGKEVSDCVESRKGTFKRDKCEGVDENDDSDTDTDTEVEDGKKTQDEYLKRMSSLQSLKSVSNINVYTSESSSTVVLDDYQGEIELERGDDEEEEEEEEVEISTSESLEESEHQEPLSHQLSVIFEESEQSEADSYRNERIGLTNAVSNSDSYSSTADNDIDENDMQEENATDSETSVTVRLPLKVTCSRSVDDKTITTVVVGDSELRQEPFRESSETDLQESDDNSDGGDISVTFTIPSRSNSIVSVECSNSAEENNENKQGNVVSEEPEVETEITIHLNRSRSEPKSNSEEKMTDSKTEICESPQQGEDDSSTTSVQSGETILNYKEDTDTDEEQGENETEARKKPEDKINKIEVPETDCDDNVPQVKDTDVMSESYKAGVGRLEELISSMLESTKNTMSRSMELSETLSPHLGSGCDLRKKESQEESEEDDSGVTSDMSTKHVNSETDGDTESDYSELSKMTKFQRASTHSRLFKLLQEECEKPDRGEQEDEEDNEDPKKVKHANAEEDSLVRRKQNLTLPLHLVAHNEVESLSSSSDLASPCSPTVSDRLVKELIHSILNKKKGKKFRKLPLAKLHAAALKILQEEMNSCDTSSTSASDDGLFLSPVQPTRRTSHSSVGENPGNGDCVRPSESGSENVYGDNYYEYLNYYNTWDHPEPWYPDDYDIVPSKAFRMLREHTNSPIPKEVIGFKARCPRVASKRDVRDAQDVASALVVSPPRTRGPVADVQESEIEREPLTFSQKQEMVSKVLEKSVKG